MNRSSQIFVSVVAPIMNELESVRLLYQAVKEVLETIDRPYEMIFVDDGSTDGTREVLRKLASEDVHLKVILFRKNFGQSAAMAAGFRKSRGRIVVAMDGDLQNDPKDIPRLLDKIEEGYDVVSGWRKNRKDRLIARKIPSRIANKLICSVTNVKLHDTGCSLKAFRREVIDRIRLYGELHRFIPGLARIEGARISEIAVIHHPRRFGRSKYNLTRTFRVLMDLSSLNLFLKYLRNPMRFFGIVGGWMLTLGSVMGIYVIYNLWIKRVPVEYMNVLVTTVFLFWATGIQFMLFGLVASLIVRTGTRRGGSLSPFLTFAESGAKEKSCG
ncbi:glycosyltransferase family 2 protein [bacterium]|nr:glycosyltransferase family 2 protein [bacterium]